MREASVERKTSETSIAAAVNLDGSGRGQIATGIGFLDHMLDQLARHSLMDVTCQAKGDLHIDYHHTTEDTGIALGQCVSKALGDRKGIVRWGEATVPMDETLTRVALDASNRPYLIWKVTFTKPKLGEMDTELFKEWFQAFAQNAGLTCTSRISTARTTTTSSNPASRVSRARFGRRSRSTRESRTRCPRPRAFSKSMTGAFVTAGRRTGDLSFADGGLGGALMRARGAA